MDDYKSLLEAELAVREIRYCLKDVFLEEEKKHPEIVALNKIAENIDVNVHSFDIGCDIDFDQLKVEINVLIQALINFTFKQKSRIFYKKIDNDFDFYAASMFSYVNCIEKNISLLTFATKKHNNEEFIHALFKDEIYFSKTLAIKIDDFLFSFF